MHRKLFGMVAVLAILIGSTGSRKMAMNSYSK